VFSWVSSAHNEDEETGKLLWCESQDESAAAGNSDHTLITNSWAADPSQSFCPEQMSIIF